MDAAISRIFLHLVHLWGHKHVKCNFTFSLFIKVSQKNFALNQKITWAFLFNLLMSSIILQRNRIIYDVQFQIKNVLIAFNGINANTSWWQKIHLIKSETRFQCMNFLLV